MTSLLLFVALAWPSARVTVRVRPGQPPPPIEDASGWVSPAHDASTGLWDIWTAWIEPPARVDQRPIPNEGSSSWKVENGTIRSAFLERVIPLPATRRSPGLLALAVAMLFAAGAWAGRVGSTAIAD